MPVLTQLERKSLPARALLAVVYALLTLGALTMVYPFLLMVGTSMTSVMDVLEYRVLPRYLTEDAALYQRHVEEKYAGKIATLTERIRRAQQTVQQQEQQASDAKLQTGISVLGTIAGVRRVRPLVLYIVTCADVSKSEAYETQQYLGGKT